MSSIEIYEIFNVTNSCLEYLTLSNINNFMFVFCSEQDESFSLIETSPKKISDKFFEFTPSNSNVSSISSPEEPNSDYIQTNSNMEGSAFDFSGMSESRDTHNDSFEAMDHSEHNDLRKYSSRSLSKKPFNFLREYLSDDSQEEEHEMVEADQNDKTTFKNTVSYVNSKPMANICERAKYIKLNEFSQTHPISTTSAHQTRPPVISRYDKEVEYKKSLNLEMSGNLIDHPTTSRAISRSLNTLKPDPNMNSSVIEVNMEIITNVNNCCNTQHSIKYSHINKPIQEMDKSPETAVQITNVSDSNLSKSINKKNSNPSNEPNNTNKTAVRDKKTNFVNNYFSKTLKQKMIKDLERLKIFRPGVNAANPIFPNNQSKLSSNIPYNLNIRIWPHSKNSEKFSVKTFILEIERILVYKKVTGELRRKITYTISFIPKFFLPEFNKCKEILYSHEQYIPKIHLFYYTIKRTIELRECEELQRIHLVPVFLKPNKYYFWKRKYVEVIKRWQYRFLKLDVVRKNTTAESNKQGKYVSRRMRDFLNMIPYIREYGEIHNPIVSTIFDKLRSFYEHIQFISVPRASTVSFEEGCMSIWKCRNKFYDTGKLGTPSQGLTTIEIEAVAVYRKIYQSFMDLSNSVLDCYMVFLREDNEGLLTYE